MKSDKKRSNREDAAQEEVSEQEPVDQYVGHGLDELETEQEKASDEESGADDQQPAAEESEAQPGFEERFLRLQADFDNFRKRTLREKEDLYKRANEDIMSELLPVLDHLELALTSAGESHADDALVKGFALVGDQLKQSLKKFGLTPIEVENVDFDPNVHEAILHMASEEVPENGIVSQTRAGYMLGKRVLRAAQVIVSSGPALAAEQVEEG